jgi:hypothetical protein
MAKIQTTGGLREFLASAINNVANGTMDSDKARNITKLAAQINESFYSEIKIAKVQKEMGKEAAELGALPLQETGKK